MLAAWARAGRRQLDSGRSLAAGLTGSWVELGAEREGLFEVFDEDADFGGDAAAGWADGEDGHGSLEGCEKAENGTFPEFRGEEPCGRLGDSQMFEDAHPHLLDIAGPEDPFGDNAFGIGPAAKDPWLRGAAFNQNDGLKAVEIFR